MRSIMLQYANFQAAADKVIEEVKMLNQKVLTYCIDMISTNVLQQEKYLEDIENKFSNTKLITILNKNDIKSETSIDELEKFKPILISAKNKSNIDKLRNEIILYINNLTGQIDNSTISSSRHYDLLNKTYEEIHKVKLSISNKVSSDLLAIDIKQAIYFLGELTGEISNDEILGNIFSKFCIGK